MISFNRGEVSSAVFSKLISREHRWYMALILGVQRPPLFSGMMVFAGLSIGWLWLGAETFRSSFDLTATTVFALTGAQCWVSRRPQMALNAAFLAIICGFLTACGGGTLCSLIMGQPTFFWWHNTQYLGAIGLGLMLVRRMGSLRALKRVKTWEVANCIALGVFVPLGAENGLLFSTDRSLLMILFCGIGFGVLTGVGGGSRPRCCPVSDSGCN